MIEFGGVRATDLESWSALEAFVWDYVGDDPRVGTSTGSRVSGEMLLH